MSVHNAPLFQSADVLLEVFDIVASHALFATDVVRPKDWGEKPELIGPENLKYHSLAKLNNPRLLSNEIISISLKAASQYLLENRPSNSILCQRDVPDVIAGRVAERCKDLPSRFYVFRRQKCYQPAFSARCDAFSVAALVRDEGLVRYLLDVGPYSLQGSDLFGFALENAVVRGHFDISN